MLSRGNSEASARLRRAKSSASIKTRRSLPFEPYTPYPLIAKEHALAAASQAFGRAAGLDLSSRAARGEASQPRISRPERPLSHSRSIRFAGPTALPARVQPITTRAAPVSCVDSETRRRSFQSDLRRSNSSIHGDDGFMTTSPLHGEYLETQVASQPSSYRKLRKSKSMFSPRDMHTTFSLTALHPPAFRTRGNAHSAVERSGQAGIRARSRLGRSFSFLRSQTKHTPPEAVIGKNVQEEAVGLARDQYLRHLERQGVDEKPWITNAAIRRGSQKTFRKTVRTSSTNSYGSAVESSESRSKDPFERRGVGGKARALSSSFKNRLKRVFNYRPSEGEGTLPVQHLQATRPHFGETTTLLDFSKMRDQRADSLNFSTPDGSSSRQKETLHVPSRRGSLAESTHSADSGVGNDDKRSRVTSWTNSTAAGTTTAQQTSGRQRLSIIQENGVVSSRLGSLRQSGSLQPHVLDHHSQPRKSSLYAKLQQRMSGSNSASRLHPPLVDAGDTSAITTENSRMSPSSHHRTSEISNHCFNDQNEMRIPTSISSTQILALEPGEHCSAPQGAGDMQREMKADRASVSTSKRPLCESKSMFFPQSTRIERSRTSPFRQAMRSNGHLEQTGIAKLTYSPYERHEGPLSLLASTKTSDDSIARSESIYSRTSGGNTPQHYNSSRSWAEIGNDGASRVASASAMAALKDKGISPKSSVDKAHATDIDMDSQNRYLEPFAPSDVGNLSRDQPDSARLRKRTGHKREHAQISGEDTDVGRLHVSASIFKDSSTAPIGLGVRSPLRHTPSQPMIDRFPLMSISTQKNPNHYGRRSPVSLNKAIPYAHETGKQQPPNQADKGRENVHPGRSAANPPSPSSNLKVCLDPHNESKGEGTGLYDNHQNGNPWPVSTLVSHSRSSPERIARLRRMYSSNNLGSPALGGISIP